MPLDINIVSMSSRASRAGDRHVAKTGLQPSYARDNFGLYISISCGSISGQLYVDKIDESKRSPGKCILVSGTWYSPSEVEALGGKKAKKWRQSLQHMGKSLCEYNLSSAKEHNKQGEVVSQCSQDDVLSQHGDNAALSQSSQGDMSSVSHPVSMSCSAATGTTCKCALLVDTTLSFVKAYRLKGDKDSLRRIIAERFSNDAVEAAKKLLWDSCKHDLETAGLSYHARRDSDKRSQLTANLDDIMQAFDALDSSDLIPAIYCEAFELLKLPPLSLDPVAEQVQSNSQALQVLISTVDSLEKKLSSLIGSSAAASLCTQTGVGEVTDKASHQTKSYAAVASSAPSSLPGSTSKSASLSLHSGVPIRRSQQHDGRECNLILFGLPEKGTILDAKEVVDEVLEFLAKKPIVIRDMFRLGKYTRHTSISSSARPRPILVKLSSAWDRKLLLLRKSNLRDFRIGRLFLREDVPPDHKLRQRKSKSCPMDERSSADASDSHHGPLQTQDPIATLSDTCIHNSLPVPQVTSDPSRYGDDIFLRRSHSPTLQDSSSSHSATLTVGDCSSSTSSSTSASSTIVQDMETSHDGST